jgi:phenol hydroxylase P2 protein
MDVGLELDVSGEGFVRAIVEAILEENPEARITEYPGYIRVTAPDRIVIRRDRIARHHPYPFQLEDVQVYVSSYFGDIKEWSDDAIVLEWGLLAPTEAG